MSFAKKGVPASSISRPVIKLTPRAEAAIKLEAEIRGKPAADKKAAEEKKKAEEKAAKDKHDEQVKAVMDAAAAASPATTYEDSEQASDDAEILS